MTSGIYKIECKGKLYIGSAVYYEKRMSNHIATLRGQYHPNKHLQRSYNKYGKKSLVFSLVEECSKEQLIKREQFFIDVLQPAFNMQPKAGSCLGVKRSEEFKRKMRKHQLRISADPVERKLRSLRAKKQHHEGKLGRITWTRPANFKKRAPPITHRQWRGIMRKLEKGIRQDVLAVQYKVSPTVISKCKRGFYYS